MVRLSGREGGDDEDGESAACDHEPGRRCRIHELTGVEAGSDYQLLQGALEATGKQFGYREDMLPGLRNLRLPDDECFTLVPATMANRLPADTRALRLLDEGLPRIDTQIVWNQTDAEPATLLVREAALEIASRHTWR